MAGPRTRPSDVQSPVPATGPSDEEMLLLEEAAQALGGAGTVAQAPVTESGASAETPYAQSGQPTPEEAALLEEAALVMERGNVPSSPDGPAMLSTETIARGKAKVGKSIKQQREIFQKAVGDDYETRVVGGALEFRKKGEEAFRQVDPGFTENLSALVSDIKKGNIKDALGRLGEVARDGADFLPEVAESLIALPATALGAAKGFAAGLGMGPVGAVVVGAAGAGAGAAAGSVTATAAREQALRMLGASPTPKDELMTEGLIGAGLSFATAGLGGAFRTAATRSAAHIVEAQGRTQVARAAKVGDLVTEFENIHKVATGQARPSLESAGRFAETVIDGEYKRMGNLIGDAWETAVRENPFMKAVPEEGVGLLTTTLRKQGYRIEPVIDRISGKVISQKLIQPEDAIHRLPALERLWKELDNGMGTPIKNYKDILAGVKSNANYGSASRTPLERTFQELDVALSRDRDKILEQAVRGTDMEGLIGSAFKRYRETIEGFRELAKITERSPEKAVKVFLRDADTARLAKSVLDDPMGRAGSVNGWEALRSAHLLELSDKFRDAKTGIVDITGLAKALNANKAVSEVVYGKEFLGEINRLGLALDKITWQGLLANPDAERNTGVYRALTKMIAAKFNPAYTANAVGAMVAYEPKILQQIQEKGIMAFAKEAKTMQERSHWLKVAKYMERLAEGTTFSESYRQRLTVNRALVPMLLRAGMRHPGEDPQEAADNYRHAIESYDARYPQVPSFQQVPTQSAQAGVR